jgi:subtilisin family serine protease
MRGVEYVIQQKKQRPGTPMVVNMSLGTTFSPTMNLGVTKLVENGIVVIVSAGNDDDDACKYSPASSQDAITVGSVDKVRICFSTHPATPLTDALSNNNDRTMIAVVSVIMARALTSLPRAATLFLLVRTMVSFPLEPQRRAERQWRHHLLLVLRLCTWTKILC